MAVELYWPPDAQQPDAEQSPTVLTPSWGFAIFYTSRSYSADTEHAAFPRDYILVTETDVYGLVTTATDDPGPVLAAMLNMAAERSAAVTGETSFRL